MWNELVAHRGANDVGHTYGPTDRCFGVIEKHLRQIETVYIPQQWYQHVKDSAVTVNSKVEVIEMQQELFHNHQIQLRQLVLITVYYIYLLHYIKDILFQSKLQRLLIWESW